MAMIPNYSPIPFAPAATRGIFDVADAAPQRQRLTPQRATMAAGDFKRSEATLRAGMLQTMRPDNSYLALDRRARSFGVSVADMVSASVALAVAAIRVPLPQAAIFSSDDDEASPQAGRTNMPSSG